MVRQLNEIIEDSKELLKEIVTIIPKIGVAFREIDDDMKYIFMTSDTPVEIPKAGLLLELVPDRLSKIKAGVEELHGALIELSKRVKEAKQKIDKS